MKKPTIIQFLIGYALLWGLGLFLIAHYSDTSGRLAMPTMYLRMATWNIAFVALNMLGTIAMIATGFCPWRERSCDHQNGR